MSIEERAKKIIATQFRVTHESIERETRFEIDLGRDSLDVTELAMELEEEFEVPIDVPIPDWIVAEWVTVGDAMDWLNEHVSDE